MYAHSRLARAGIFNLDGYVIVCLIIPLTTHKHTQCCHYGAKTTKATRIWQLQSKRVTRV
jgi:hypothetical protein